MIPRPLGRESFNYIGPWKEQVKLGFVALSAGIKVLGRGNHKGVRSKKGVVVSLVILSVGFELRQTRNGVRGR